MDEHILSALQDLGLTRSEARVYVALVASGVSAATDIARDARVPHPRIYDIIANLSDKGLVEIQTGKRRKYKAIRPDVAFERLLKRFRERGEQVTHYLSKIYNNAKKEIPSIWMLKGRNNIINKISEILDKVENELLLAIPANMLGTLKKHLKRAEKKGVVTSLVIYPNENERQIDEEITRYADIRVRKPLGSILALADFNDCLLCSHKAIIYQFPLDEGHAIVAGDLELLQTLSYFFYHSLWHPAKPIKEEVFLKKYPKNFVHMWKAIEEAEMLREKGFEIKAFIKGNNVKDNSPVEFEAKIIKTKINNGRIYSLLVEKPDGTKIALGGRGASIEHVEVNTITIMPLESTES
ncbi:MAG: TrmB family transcriptional regulator [Candidatus Heimdallarchaeota archaeon]